MRAIFFEITILILLLQHHFQDVLSINCVTIKFKASDKYVFWIIFILSDSAYSTRVKNTFILDRELTEVFFTILLDLTHLCYYNFSKLKKKFQKHSSCILDKQTFITYVWFIFWKIPLN